MRYRAGKDSGRAPRRGVRSLILFRSPQKGTRERIFWDQAKCAPIDIQDEPSLDSWRIAAMSLKRKAVRSRLKVARRTGYRMYELNRTVGEPLRDIEEPLPIGVQWADEMVHCLKRH